ncbi:MAG: heavy metal translocating P-type ATPase [Neisseria sp.]|nr:heavy metal translocating P-type ATPase [Neisseria sp.]
MTNDNHHTTCCGCETEPLATTPTATTCCGAAASASSACCSGDATLAITPDHAPPHRNRVRYHVPEMDCAVEQAQITQALESLAGIERLAFHLSDRILSIDAADAVQAQAVRILQQTGFKPNKINEQQASSLEQKSFWQTWGRLLLALGLALSAELIGIFFPENRISLLSETVLALSAIFLAGSGVLKKGLVALSKLHLTINALMAVAVIGAFLIGEWPEAAMVMSLFALSEALEARAVDKARHAIQALLSLSPQTASVQTADGRWQEQTLESIATGSLLRVMPGGRIALDGVVVQGKTTVDQTALTGESLPVEKAEGDVVFAGTVNQAGSIVMRSSAPAGDTTLAKIIHAVEKAQNERAPTQRLVDRFARYYTPTVFFLALAVMLFPPLLLGWPWLKAVYQALVLLVIACPCALVIATPVTIVSSLATAARIGLIIKGGVYLEQARLLQAVAFDKTGTITQGQPELVAWIPLTEALSQRGLSTKQARELTALMAGSSDHPVSAAIARGLAWEKPLPRIQIEQLSGRGIQGLYASKPYRLVNRRYISEQGFDTQKWDDLIHAYEQQAQTVTLLSDDAGPLALCVVADVIKPHAADAIRALSERGVHTVMLSGDNPHTAQAIALQAGIQEAQGHLLPEGKLNMIEQLKQQHGLTAMVGDGMNDAPALAKADIGFAMGGIGSDIAMETADIVVMNDDLHSVVKSIDLSKKTHSVLWQNIVLALGIKLVFLVLTLFSMTTMWMAVFADVGASLLVIFNGMRMLMYRP